MTRYFKATNGMTTVFRATKAGLYVAARIDPMIAFSKTMKPGYWPAVEISKTEYAALVAAKVARLANDWRHRDPKNWPRHDAQPRWWGTSPQDSWVRNADMEVAA